jgi:hypothetical protein
VGIRVADKYLENDPSQESEALKGRLAAGIEKPEETWQTGTLAQMLDIPTLAIGTLVFEGRRQAQRLTAVDQMAAHHPIRAWDAVEALDE